MAYPGDPFFDPSRPAWLAYWIDTPTESAAKYAWLASAGTVTAGQVIGTAYPAPPAPPAVKPPADVITPPASQEDAERTINEILARQMSEWHQANQQFYDDFGTPAPSFWDRWKWWIIAGAAGAAVISLNNGRSRR